jgi:5-methylcytosine-specific restriction protein A
MNKSLSTKSHSLFVAFVANSKWGMSGVGISVFEAGLRNGLCAWGHSKAVLAEMSAGDLLLLGYGEMGNAPAEVGAWNDKELAVAVLCRLKSGLFEDGSVWPPSGSDFYDETHTFRIEVEEINRWNLPNSTIINDIILEGFRESARRLGAPFQLHLTPNDTAFDIRRLPARPTSKSAVPPEPSSDTTPAQSASTVVPLNPPWTQDELILVLDLYLRHGVLDPGQPAVEQLCDVLNTLPVHPYPLGDRPFRDANGISLKLADFAAIDPTHDATATVDEQNQEKKVWEQFADDADSLRSLSEKIPLLAATRMPDIQTPVDDEDEIAEGRIVFREHRLHERNQTLVSKKRRQVQEESGRVTCEVCGFNFKKTYGRRGAGFIEAHHLRPLTTINPGTDTTADLAFVCANCHRMMHRAEPWLTPTELRASLSGRKK